MLAVSGKMQEQSINLKAFWERPTKPVFRAETAVDAPPLIGPGFLAFHRKYIADTAEDDYPRDRMQRVCCNFQDTIMVQRDTPYIIPNYYMLAGVALFGESTGNPLMPITYARYGMVNYRNTGNSRIEAGDDVYFLWPNERSDHLAARLSDIGDARPAITVSHKTFVDERTVQGMYTKNDSEITIRPFFVGRSLLAADAGAIGTLFMSG